MIKIILSFILSTAICFFASAGWALQPHEILVIANRNAARSVGLAEYYMKKRALIMVIMTGPSMLPPSVSNTAA